MKYQSETKDEWAEEMNDNELIKDIVKTKIASVLLSCLGLLMILFSLIHYIFGFLGVALIICGVEAHMKFRYFQIIKLIKNKKEEK